MQIAVYNLKGGVGKTSLALNLAEAHELGLVTNDVLPPYEKFIPQKRLMKISPSEDIPLLPDEYDIVYDLGGYADARVIPVLKKVDCVIVPTFCDAYHLDIAHKALENIAQFTNRILVVLNGIKKPGEFTAAQRELKTVHPCIPLSYSKSFETMLQKGKTVRSLQRESPDWRKHVYNKILSQLDELDAVVKTFTKEGGLTK